MYTSVEELINHVSGKYEKALSEYEEKCILLERYDLKYLDSDNNIFNEDHTILMSFISKYRIIKNQKYNRNYKDARGELYNLKKEITDYLKRMDHRLRQIKDQGTIEKLRSEQCFLQNFGYRLELAINMIDCCLIPFEEYADECSGKSIDICEDKDYVLFLVNKCLILNHTSLFNDECVKILDKLTTGLAGRNAHDNKLLFRVGILNVEYRLYKNAEVIFKMLIDKLKNKILNNDEKYMYFLSYMMLVSSYEYSGQYNQALAILIGEDEDQTPAQVCNRLLEKLSGVLKMENKDIDDLCFAWQDKQKQEDIIELLRRIMVVKNPFNSEISKFAYQTGDIFLDIAKKKNKDKKDYIQQLFSKKGEAKGEVIKRVEEKYIELEDKNKPLHDYLHLLAHCINEEAVLIIRRQHLEEEVYQKLLILARAIMLLVSEDEETYKGAHSFKTCFSTIYAEAGEFHIANRSMTEIMNSQYNNMDVVSKAEIDFFYYLIPRIDDISNGSGTNYSIEGDKYYNHYLNCCYRNFDFDAISHISLLSFEYQIAVLLQEGDLTHIASKFKNNICSSEEDALEAKYHQVINIQNLDAHNIWLKNERNKVKYIYQFLKLYLALNETDRVIRSPRIYEIAYQYLKINNSFGQNPDLVNISYLDFENEENVLKSIEELFGDTKRDSSFVSINNVKLVLLYSPDMEYDPMSVYFIYAPNVEKGSVFEDEDNPAEFVRIRYFDNKSAAIKEFFLMATLMQIKQDFINPSRFFIMTPVNNAEPCKFMVPDDQNLIIKNYENDIDSEYNFNDINAQYSFCLGRPFMLSKNWLSRLNLVNSNWVWALTFAIKEDELKDIQYMVFFPDKTPIISLIYERKKCKENINKLYKKANLRHWKDCNSVSKKCQVWKVDRIENQEVKQLFECFPEILWENNKNDYKKGKLLLWKFEQEQMVVWRMVFTQDSQNIDSIMMKMCNYGQETPFVRLENNEVQKWPVPYDIEHGTKPFVFICHLGKEDDFVKKELNTFFEVEGIRYWYDHEMILGKTWIEEIKKIINKDNCAGCIMLVTKQEFFESSSVNLEFRELWRKKQKCPDFSIIPIIYDCYGESTLEELVRRAYGQGSVLYQESYNICIELLGIGNPNFLKVYLNDINGNTLQEYHTNEIKMGRERGAVLEVCKNIKVIKEEV